MVVREETTLADLQAMVKWEDKSVLSQTLSEAFIESGERDVQAARNLGNSLLQIVRLMTVAGLDLAGCINLVEDVDAKDAPCLCEVPTKDLGEPKGG